MGIAQAMLSDDPAYRDAIVNRAVLLAAVQRQMFCQGTGRVLDVRTAVLVTFKQGDKSGGAMVLHGDAYDESWKTIVEEAAREAGYAVETIDGRDYTAKGEPRKRART